MAKRWQRSRNDAGSLLASSFIITLGSAGCLFTVAAMSPNSMPIAIWTVGGMVACFFLFVVLQRFGKVPQTDLSFLLLSRKNRRDDGLAEYRPRKIGEGQASHPGTNQPISAAEAHEIQINSANTWVPAQSRGGQRK